MTIRQDAARLFSNKIIGKTLPYSVNASSDVKAFVGRQDLPKSDGPETTQKEHERKHTIAWTRFWMALYREYPGEEPDHQQTTEQNRY